MKTTFIKSSCIFHKNVRSWRKIQVYSSFNHVLCLILEEKNMSKISFLEISQKNLEKIHFLISISSHFDFAFPSRKRVKAKKFHFANPEKSESQYFSVSTSRIKVKTFLKLFKPTLAGTCIQAPSSSRLFPFCWTVERLCTMSRVCNCLMRQQVYQPGPRGS